MFRFAVLLATVATVALAAGHAPAQPPGFGELRVIDAKVEKNRLVWSAVRYVPAAKEMAVEVVVNGMKVIQKVTVTELVPVVETLGTNLKGLKATDGAGKPIDIDKLAEMLKEPTPVVLLTGPLTDKHRGLFKDKTVFIEQPPPEPGTLVPPPVPVPVIPSKM